MNSYLTQVIARFLFLPILVVSIAVLFKGYASVGDGFSAGSIAAAAVLIEYLAFGSSRLKNQSFVRYSLYIALFGLLLALVDTFFPLLLGEPIFSYFPQAGQPVVHLGSLQLDTSLLFDTGIYLLVFGFVTYTIDYIGQILSEDAS